MHQGEIIRIPWENHVHLFYLYDAEESVVCNRPRKALMKTTFQISTPLVGALLIAAAVAISPARVQSQTWSDNYNPSFGRLRDTLYLLDSTYLEIRLDRQMIYQHFRGGRVDGYPCSTGDPSIKDGVATRPGIFSVQSKATKTMSAAFQVYLNYWIGFDGGIGLHGLDGRSYYKYLGRRASSHGCVRMSNETGAQLFRRVPTGTIVYVHNGSPARVLRFADPGRTDLVVMDKLDNELLERRLAAVEALRWDDSSLARPLALPARKRFTKIIVGTVNPTTVVQFPIPIIQTDIGTIPKRGEPPTPLRSPIPSAPLIPS